MLTRTCFVFHTRYFELLAQKRRLRLCVVFCAASSPFDSSETAFLALKFVEREKCFSLFLLMFAYLPLGQYAASKADNRSFSCASVCIWPRYVSSCQLRPGRKSGHQGFRWACISYPPSEFLVYRSHALLSLMKSNLKQTVAHARQGAVVNCLNRRLVKENGITLDQSEAF